MPIVTRCALLGHRLLASSLELLGAAEAFVCEATFKQTTRDIGVDVHALGLAVGAMWPADNRAFVPGEAKPAQRR